MTDNRQHTISGDLIGQFESAFDMLGEAVPRFSAEQWRQDADHGLAPARVAFHLLDTVEYYMSPDPRRFKSGARFGVDWEDAPAAAQPGQEQISTYLAEIRAGCRRWMEGLDDAAMLTPDPVYGREGMSRLDLRLYVLRHTHHHIAEIAAHLRRCGLPRPGWR